MVKNVLWHIKVQLKVLTIDFQSAFGCIKTEIIADVTKKLSSVSPVQRTDRQHPVAIMKAESASRNQRLAIFHPHSGRHEAVSITGQVHRGITFY